MNLIASAEGLYLPQHGLILDRQAQQQYIEKAAGDLFTGRNQKPFVLPDGWQRQDVTVSGIVVEKYTNTNSDSDKVLLQLHGGGYVLGMSDGHRLMALKQAALMDAKEAYCVNYRLAPNYVYPAALDDAIAAYNYLLDSGIKAETRLSRRFGRGKPGRCPCALFAGPSRSLAPTVNPPVAMDGFQYGYGFADL